MKSSRLLFLLLPLAVSLTACDTKAKEQLATLAHTDSLRQDSIVNVKNDLMNEVMGSAQFITEINTELAKAKNLDAKASRKLVTQSEITDIKQQRQEVVSKIALLVQRLDGMQSALANTSARAKQLAQHDSSLLLQVASYEKTVTDLKASLEQQRTELQGVIDKQGAQIVALNGQVDTLTHKSVALADTVSQLTTEKNTAYYVVGTKEDLVKQGVLVEEGHKRFLLLGSRNVQPARELDPSKFIKIDRLKDRAITLPDGEYQILSRQSPSYATPASTKDGKIAGGLTIDKPEQFWSTSRFLILVRS